MVNAYSELASVKQLRVQAQYDLMKAKLDYLSATGNLAQWAKIPDVSKAGEAEADQENNKDKKKGGKDKAEQPLKLTSLDGETGDAVAPLDLESYNDDEDEGEPYTGPEQVFVHVSDSGELIMETGNLDIRTKAKPQPATRASGKAVAQNAKPAPKKKSKSTTLAADNGKKADKKSKTMTNPRRRR